MTECIFCDPVDEKNVIQNDLCYARWSNYEVSKGHMLVVPFRHLAGYFEATDEEKAAIWALVDEGKGLIDQLHHPDGYNVGINIGEAAGQTIMHLHVHIMPRYKGDMEDPRGGVRGVIPEKQKYHKGS
ncbi:MAG: HIT family protein [Gammaproteobacteria bacterium]|nr:HIT family protein [Gammaproteobacteria bacterium]